MDDFYLNTQKMDDVICRIETMAKEMRDIKEEYQKTITRVLESWQGEGRMMFDKKSYELLRKFTDISDSFYGIAEDLLVASTTYMGADTLLAKGEIGRTARY